MSWIERGRPRNSYDRHKTYETDRVQQRLDSVQKVVQSKVEQALQVDATDVIIFKKAKMGLTCSCNKVDNDIFDEQVGGMKSLGRESSAMDAGVKLGTVSKGMFGGGRQTVSLDDIDDGMNAVMDAADLMGNGDEEVSNGWDAGNVVNCGICFRQGVVPGFISTGFVYNVMTHHHAKVLTAYTLDQSTSPATFRQVRKDGHVDFDQLIPKYFTQATYSVRLNDQMLPAFPRPVLVVNGVEQELTAANLEPWRGKHVIVRIKDVAAFTHATIIFDLGVSAVKGNISEEANVLNYDQELTVGNITVVLPARSGAIEPEDILVLPFKNYVLKVMEAPKKRTAKNEQWEWVCTTRPVQRKEIAYNIFKGNKIR
ncbi:hypothetical protein pEaSNUABM35_00217 [Erwinia phage pEa_SNUABM_35]|uniref:Uncharacterized protein n=1 Tax=Erwinia phage pEa_SNUABM_35 TaxID=2869557 RepID=A0AAE7XPB4_9CAUD|nr:hypothetical protein MPK65_gp217 [Erwinia phage pEa_SNUABM_35]QZE60134.1 hypothetical protein pEaSNUABM35_00217 [Erwinia phage pEa_SNUABM_35]QZE60470.1 hypothetical protein pEaSNUABM36_00217 [Erwinia phage pEa_SNUABM_36]